MWLRHCRRPRKILGPVSSGRSPGAPGNPGEPQIRGGPGVPGEARSGDLGGEGTEELRDVRWGGDPPICDTPVEDGDLTPLRSRVLEG